MELIKNKNKKNNFWYTVFLIPALLLFIFLFALPLIQGFIYTFTDWNGVSRNYNFVGILNYKNLLKDDMFKLSIVTTFKYAILVMIFQNAIGLLLAVVLDNSIKAKNFFRTVFFMPTVLSVILAGFIWSSIYAKALPAFGNIFGVYIPSMLGNPKLVIPALVIIQLWQWSGHTMIIYIAGLQTIPRELYESAKVDGAGVFQTFRHVTFPLLGPSITINSVLVLAGALKVFDLVYATTSGGPGYSSTTITLEIYNTTFTTGLAGYGATMAFVFFIFIILITLLQVKILSKREVEM